MRNRVEKKELWKDIPDFPDYMIGDQGNVFNKRLNRTMATSLTKWGTVKISLINREGNRRTMGVIYLVAEAFVEKPNMSEYNTSVCDHVIVKNGDPTNISAENLAWRPRWFAWKYVAQFRKEWPSHYHNLAVINRKTGRIYRNIIEAGIDDGVLFHDIWRSTYSGAFIFPYDAIYEILR